MPLSSTSSRIVEVGNATPQVAGTIVGLSPEYCVNSLTQNRRSDCLVKHCYRTRPKYRCPLLVRWSIHQQREGRCCRSGPHAVCPANNQHTAAILRKPGRLRSRLATLISGAFEGNDFRVKMRCKLCSVRECDTPYGWRFRVSGNPFHPCSIDRWSGCGLHWATESVLVQ
jgi:hypothetical protein